MTVDALAFDLYGTLLDVRSLDRLCVEAAGSEAVVPAWRQKQLEYTWLRAAMGRYEDFWTVTVEALDYTLERLGLSVAPEARRRMLDGWLALRAYPEVPAALARMAPKTLAVLSNGSPSMVESALRSAELRQLFAHVLSVDAVKTYKPVPDVYALAERRLGLTRSAILFVSSNAWDAAGAKAFGLPVAWVNRAGAPPERLGFAPDVIVRDLAELAERVNA
ncbi:MAG TPA: haloacid dehalogenase type II [bacterium]|jgi:2-haloacid dehalogenase|nr:haloacid dehalogenase type II [bacterium]